MAKPKQNPMQPTLPGIELDLQQTFEFAKPPAPRAAAKAKPPADGPAHVGRAVEVPVPDFSNPRRPKTCLEVDFPIVPINELSALEGNAGKPIYQMSKWWARRRSSVFRAMLIAAAMQAPIRTHPDGTPVLDSDGIPVPDEVRQFFDQIEAEVKPVIQPFYVAGCPRGHQGRWYELSPLSPREIA